jgi:hypothetical protein
MNRFASHSALTSCGSLVVSLVACGAPSSVADTTPARDARIVDREAKVTPIMVESTNRESVAQPAPTSAQPAVTWAIGSAPATEGHSLSVLGAPTVGESELGPTVCFDGKDDALLFPVNPLQGLSEFTIEVLFKPDPDGGTEQRFLHVQEDGTENRALLELRLTTEGSFYLDTFLRSGDEKLTLAVEKQLHPAGRWYWAALSYQGEQMSHYVNGVKEAEGKLKFAPLNAGQMSLGVRLNRVSWFKGCVREIRFGATALPATELQRVSAQ